MNPPLFRCIIAWLRTPAVFAGAQPCYLMQASQFCKSRFLVSIDVAVVLSSGKFFLHSQSKGRSHGHWYGHCNTHPQLLSVYPSWIVDASSSASLHPERPGRVSVTLQLNTRDNHVLLVHSHHLRLIRGYPKCSISNKVYITMRILNSPQSDHRWAGIRRAIADGALG